MSSTPAEEGARVSFNVSGRLQGHGRKEILVLVHFLGSLAHPDHVSRLSWPC